VLNFAPSADAYVDSSQPAKNFGKTPTVRVNASPTRQGYLKFAVSGVNGAQVQSAKLRLYAKASSVAGGTLAAVANTTWGETTLTWNNRPAAAATATATLPAVTNGRWYEADVSSLVKGDGTYALRIASTSTDEATYATAESGAATAPQLVVTALPGDTSAPTVPATPTAKAAAPTRVELSWPASSDDVGVTGYRVYRDGAPLATTTTPSYADTTAVAGTTYSYAVTAYDAAGNESAKSAAVSVTTPTASQAATLTFLPTDDTYVQEDVPNSNFGGDQTTIVDGSPRRYAFLKYNVSGIGTAKVTKTVLRLSTDTDPAGAAAVMGGLFQNVPDTTWTQGTLTWNNQPVADSAILGRLGPVSAGTTYDVDVTGLVTKDGTVTVRISSTDGDGTGYYATEAASIGKQPARLIVTTG
jgi:hypothetical protein